MQDLIRGIKKIIGDSQPQPVTKETLVLQSNAGAANITALIKRGNIALEDEEWEKADAFFEEALNQDAECAEAYLGKLLAKCHLSNATALAKYYVLKSIKNSADGIERKEACPEATAHIEAAVSQYTVLGFLSDAEIKEQYAFDRTYIPELPIRKQQKRRVGSELAGEKLLNRAQQYATGETKDFINKMMSYINLAFDKRIADASKDEEEKIASIGKAYEKHLNEADEKVKALYNKALINQEKQYQYIVSYLNTANTISDYEYVVQLLKDMQGYKDTAVIIDNCWSKIVKLRQEIAESDRLFEEGIRKIERQAEKKKQIIGIFLIASFFLFFIFSCVGAM